MIGCIIRSYRLTDYLERVLRLYFWVDKIVIANYKYKPFDEDIDDTYKIVRSMNMPNVVIVTGDKPILQSSAFFIAQEHLKDCEIIFIADADEFLLLEDQRRCIDALRRNMYLAKIECQVIDYKKPDASEAYAQRTHTPVVAVRYPAEFSGTRYALGDCYRFQDMFMHHFGYCMKEYEWKKRNLWYGAHSADLITSSPTSIMTPPIALVEALSKFS